MTEAKRRGRPATGVTPVRNVRIGPLWDEALEIAKSRDETLTSVIEAALKRYVTRHRES